MSKAVSRGQALQVAARVGTQVDWDALDGDELQKGIIDLTPEEFKKRFTAFLKSSAKVVGIIISAVLSLIGIAFDPVKFIGKDWAIWKGSADGDGLAGDEAQDAEALAMTELDATKMQFETCLKAGKTSITGEEKLKRLIALNKPLLGAKQFLALWLDYQKNGEQSVLEWLRREKSINYLDFFGTILRGPDGSRFVLCLCWYGGQWYWYCHWIGLDWYGLHSSAVLAS